jgi:hypothetical protein
MAVIMCYFDQTCIVDEIDEIGIELEIDDLTTRINRLLTHLASFQSSLTECETDEIVLTIRKLIARRHELLDA